MNILFKIFKVNIININVFPALLFYLNMNCIVWKILWKFKGNSKNIIERKFVNAVCTHIYQFLGSIPQKVECQEDSCCPILSLAESLNQDSVTATASSEPILKEAHLIVIFLKMVVVSWKHWKTHTGSVAVAIYRCHCASSVFDSPLPFFF